MPFSNVNAARAYWQSVLEKGRIREARRREAEVQKLLKLVCRFFLQNYLLQILMKKI